MLQNNNTLYFLHIPKTAGSSIIGILDNYFSLDSILPEEVWNHLLKNLPTDFSKYGLIRGHFGYGLHRLLPTKPVYMTMLRNPLERTISFYHHITVDPITNNWIRLSKVEDLSTLLDDQKINLIFKNPQTRYLALDLDVISMAKSMDKERLGEFFYESTQEFLSPGITDEELLTIAKRRLSEVQFFGLTERFEESLLLMCFIFGWNPPHKIWKQMVLPSRPQTRDFSESVIKKINEITQLDKELYQYAEKIFEERFSRMIHELEKRYDEPTLENLTIIEKAYKFLEKRYSEQFSNNKIDSVDYTFDKPLSGDGWYPRENYNNSGRIFRWTGPDKTATIDFPLRQDEDLQIRFNVMMCMSFDILKSVELKINNNSIPITMSQKAENTTFEGIIPKSFLTSDKNFVRFTFSVNDTISPNSIDPNHNDIRKLGIVMDRIIINKNSSREIQ